MAGWGGRQSSGRHRQGGGEPNEGICARLLQVPLLPAAPTLHLWCGIPQQAQSVLQAHISHSQSGPPFPLLPASLVWCPAAGTAGAAQLSNTDCAAAHLHLRRGVPQHVHKLGAVELRELVVLRQAGALQYRRRYTRRKEGGRGGAGAEGSLGGRGLLRHCGLATKQQTAEVKRLQEAVVEQG